MRPVLVLAVLCGGILLTACPPWVTGGAPPESVPEVTVDSTPRRPVVVRDTGLERQVDQLHLQLLEKQAQVEELQAGLDDARREVVRAMAKLQTLATRAEAASGMAEAEIALQTLRAARGGGVQAAAEIDQAVQLLRLAVAEFNRQNYGGALYLATQGKAAAAAGQARLAGLERGSLRSGEVAFAVPLPLKAVSRANVREGPGGGFAVLFVLDAGAPVTGYSYVDQWVRIATAAGRGGWIYQGLIDRQR